MCACCVCVELCGVGGGETFLVVVSVGCVVWIHVRYVVVVIMYRIHVLNQNLRIQM